MTFPRLPAAILACAMLAGLPLAARAATMGDGRRIAEQTCRNCHALEGRLFSSNREAPPLSGLTVPYSEMEVRDALAGQGMLRDHPVMTAQNISGDDADAVVFYLKSIGMRFSPSLPRPRRP